MESEQYDYFSSLKRSTIAISLLLLFSSTSLFAEHRPNSTYTERNIEKIAFPIGGIGAGNFFIEGNGCLSGVSVKHRLNFFSEPVLFAAVCVKGQTPDQNIARVLEGPIPEYKYSGRPGAATGSWGKTYGLPRFTQCRFNSRFPFCAIDLKDDAFPLSVKVVGFSPFIPNEPNLSGLPAGSVEYALTNDSAEELELVFSVSANNFMGGSSFEKIDGGFNVVGPDGKFALALKDDRSDVKVDCCWYRGGWFDSLSVLWRNILRGSAVDNSSRVDGKSPGASLFLPCKIGPNETKTFRLLTAWYVPTSNISAIDGVPHAKILMSETPAQGTAAHQQEVTGHIGKSLVNTYYPGGDGHVGEIVSPSFKVDKKNLFFKVGGGSLEDVGVALQIEEGGEFKTQKIFRGSDRERLEWVGCNLEKWVGKEARIYIFDNDVVAWGHVNADCFLLTDLDEKEFDNRIAAFNENAQKIFDDKDIVVLNDFEDGYGDWKVVQTIAEDQKTAVEEYEKTYRPWYAARFDSLEDVLAFFDSQYDVLRERSEKFASALKDSTLSPEVAEAVEAASLF